MTPAVNPLTVRSAWKALEAHRDAMRDVHLRKLFADDPKRGERMTAEDAGIYLDYSKNRVTDDTLRLLVRLAEESGLRARIDAMFRGDRINITENRAASQCCGCSFGSGVEKNPEPHHDLESVTDAKNESIMLAK